MSVAPPRRPKRGHSLPLLIALGVVASGAWYGWSRFERKEPAHAARPPEAVPVSLATVEAGPFAQVLGGLGTAQAYNTVQVRTRVDGEITQVAFREGQVVRKGDLLVQIDPRPFQATLEAAKAKKMQDEANLKNIKADVDRSTRLGDYASRQQLETQTAQAAQMTAQVAADQAAIDGAQTQLGYATVRSPLEGVTGFRQVDSGNIVNAAGQTPIVTIAQVEPIYVVFTAPETELSAVTRALAAGPVPVEAWSTDGRTKLSAGKLDLINNQVDVATGTVRLKASFANADHVLWPGLSVSTRMTVGTIREALTIPEDGVQHGPKGLYAFVVDGARRAHVRPIEVGRVDDGRTLVTKGLSSGDRVIVQGQYRVQEGTLVADPKADEAPRTAKAEPAPGGAAR